MSKSKWVLVIRQKIILKIYVKFIWIDKKSCKRMGSNKTGSTKTLPFNRFSRFVFVFVDVVTVFRRAKNADLFNNTSNIPGNRYDFYEYIRHTKTRINHNSSHRKRVAANTRQIKLYTYSNITNSTITNVNHTHSN